MMENKDDIATVHEIDKNSVEHLNVCLSELGCQLSDVFGADMVLWVEGPTEAAAFPLILTRLIRLGTGGIQILPVHRTGDFSKNQLQQSLEVFRSLTCGKSLLPKAIGLLFDAESLTEKEIAVDFKRQADIIEPGCLEFLPLRLFENYLLDSEAIAEVLTGFFREHELPALSSAAVEEWLSKQGQEQKYFPKREPIKYLEKGWLEAVHGAQLLEDLTRDFSSGNAQFQKTKHSVQLTEWLVERKPNKLRPLALFLDKFIQGRLLAVSAPAGPRPAGMGTDPSD